MYVRPQGAEGTRAKDGNGREVWVGDDQHTHHTHTHVHGIEEYGTVRNRGGHGKDTLRCRRNKGGGGFGGHTQGDAHKHQPRKCTNRGLGTRDVRANQSRKRVRPPSRWVTLARTLAG